MELDQKQAVLYARMTDLQKRVVAGVEAGKSQRQAYFDAGGTASNPVSADTTVSELLSNPNVVAFRESLHGTKINHLIMTREEMRARLTAIARGDVAEIVRVKKRCIGYDEETAEPIYQSYVDAEDFDNVPRDALTALAEVSQKKDGISIKMQNSVGAMKLLAALDGLEAPTRVITTNNNVTPDVLTKLSEEELNNLASLAARISTPTA